MAGGIVVYFKYVLIYIINLKYNSEFLIDFVEIFNILLQRPDSYNAMPPRKSVAICHGVMAHALDWRGILEILQILQILLALIDGYSSLLLPSYMSQCSYRHTLADKLVSNPKIRKLESNTTLKSQPDLRLNMWLKTYNRVSKDLR